MDADRRAELARLLADQFGVLPRPRRLPAAAADHPVLADWRRLRRSLRPPAHPHGVAVPADGDVGHAGPPDVLPGRAGVAHPRAVVRHRHRAVVRRARVSIAHPVARRQEGSAERGRAELDPVQRRARAGPAALRRHARRVPRLRLQRAAGDERVLPAQLAVVRGRDQHADDAAREAHSAGRARRACGTSCRAGSRTSGITAA